MKGKKRHAEKCDQTQNVLGWLREEIAEKGKYTALNLFSVTKIVVVVVVVFDLQMEEERRGKANITKSFVYRKNVWRVLANQRDPLRTRWCL